jgi:L-alanine-DL-glutamate epimerase-like enolase superfamily enzyme
MRITSVDIYKANIDYFEPFRIAIMVSEGTENVFVRINTDSDLYGIGEASPTGPITGDTQEGMCDAAVQFAELLIGLDPLAIDVHTATMRDWLTGNTTIRSAFDMALYDLFGKAVDLPLYAVLGGTNRKIWTDNTIGIADPDEMAQTAAAFQSEGYKAIKVKLGTGVEEDIARVRAIRDAVGDFIPLRIDANQGWDFPAACEILRSLEPLHIQYCEQPLAAWDLDGMAHLRERTSIPLMADESLFDHHDALKLAGNRACDYFNIKLAKSAGIHTALKIDSVAQAAGITCMVGCMSETRLGLSAAAHLISARPNIRFADLDSHFDHRVDPILGGVEIGPDGVIIPDSPGHGADVDPDFLAECECLTVE